MSVLITTKKNIDRTPLQDNDIPEEFDVLLEELDDIPPELDLDDLEGFNNIPIEAGDLEQEHNVIDELIEKPPKGIHKKRM
jgi:hypothetical protein